MSDMQQMMKDTCQRFLADVSIRENWENQPHDDLPTGDWANLSELGLPRVAMPEELGGVGGDFQDMCEMAYVAGYSASHLPLVEAMLGNWLCGMAGFEIAEDAVPMLAMDSLISDELAQPATGTVRNLRSARFATHFLLPETRDGALWVSLVDREGVTVENSANAADEPSDMVANLASAEVIATAQLSCDPVDLAHVSALLHASQMSGAMEHALEMTMQYTQDRSQFGRPLVKFQAVQHMIAEATAYIGASRRISAAAADAWGTDNFGFLAAVAKGYTSESVGPVTDACHQCFGAMGFTRECLLHVFTRRLWCWREEFGSERYWYGKVGEKIRKEASDDIWSFVADM
ncbi:acyl-CoA/acyl-ACP dehydrogenase [Pseudohalocynthiibacter aestuariivivens]|nr:acyl-CoA dehydrogenase family protein [Pseudohalocynthiibacter aestuariivivens]QIE45961.1 acyl-CoA/acyl-ACP dehydrogenase [Pseudohalocynthiibacter aestuariivivens]